MTGAAAPWRLPFTVIDEAVHVLDSRAEPWGIEIELDLPGRLDEARLRAAVAAAAGRHPMARVRQLPARRTDRTWTWEVAPAFDVDPVRVVTCAGDDELALARDGLHSRQVPLVESPPFRLLLARRPAGDALLLTANHAAFDGHGCLRLLHSVARAYAGRPDPDPPVPLDEARDVRRLVQAPDAAVRRNRLRLIASKIADLARPPARLAPAGAEDLPGYRVHHVALSAEETEAVKRSEATVNDVLLVALVRTVAAWNAGHGAPTGRVGVLVPVNLRPREWSTDVVTNLVLDARVAARPGPADAVLAAVTEQSERIRAGGGAALIEAIGGWGSVPIWATSTLPPLLWLTGNRLLDTALLSNLGALDDVPDFGAGPAEAVWFSAPARMPCGLSIGAATVGGRLCLSFRTRPPLLGPAAVLDVARRFGEEVGRVAET